VLLVNLYFPPDTSATARIFSDLVDSLTAANHDVTVLCGRPSYRPTEQRRWSPLRRERRYRLTVERVGSAARPMTSVSARAANYLSFLGLAALRVAFRRRPDVVIAGSDPPLAVLCGVLAARGRPIVYHLQDLHPEAAVAAGWLRSGRIEAIWERLHRLAVSRCDLVVCLGRDMAALMERKGVPADRTIVVPNGAPPGGPVSDPALVERLRGGDRFVILHAGNLGVAGAWETIACAAQSLNGAASFVCVGGGARESEFRRWNIRLEPFQADVSAVMAAGDVQLVTQRTEMEGLLVPSKLYTALAHGRPVLAVVPPASEAAATIREWECGVVASPDDPEDIVRKVRELRDNPARLDAMATRAQAAGRHFDRSALFDALVREIETLLAG
jgi:glycosyltransferase involved in cell wall biosynthesis